MASGETGWSEIPEDRYNLKGVYHSNHERNSTTHVKGGHFLQDDVAAFDAAFFNYSAEMAQAVDPQFRLQLESTYEALENELIRMVAGLPLSQVMGSQTSVFAGVFTHDYQEGIIRDEDRLPRFNVVGTWSPMSSNRISHFFDFRGASMTLETGCSTTLVALHQALHTLRNREADMSVVTGANIMLNPDTFKAIGSLGMLSPDGRSYAFDSRANGYGRGEGVATIIIKRLLDALAANDPIRAVIRETALNQDSKTDTITTPSATAQVELMRECYRRASLDPRGTQYFKAHGTGTPTGDPIKAGAIAAIFGDSEGRNNEEYYLRIGSVKTNVGHTGAASGLAAIVKGILCLKKGLIPPTVNYKTPNSKLKLDKWRLKVARTIEQWPDNLDLNPVNGYGSRKLNGNGHINGKVHINRYCHPNDAKVLILSARDERGCKQMVSDLKAYLEKHKSLSHDASEQLLRNLSYTLGERQSLFQWVVALQVRLEKDSTLDTAIQALNPLRLKPSRQDSNAPRIGMIFTGQGAQWHAIGQELLTSYPIFRQSIEESKAFLQTLGANWSLLKELQRDAKTTRVHATKISIPVCVALQITLMRLLESWGIIPSAVASHSSGEIAAAFAVGALTHRQAMATAYYRAMLVADESQRSPGAVKGAMAAVSLGVGAVQTYLDRLTKDNGKAAVVACINSPQSVTISGDSDAVSQIEDMCKQDGVFARRLRVQQAYHSHHMDAFADAYQESLKAEMARDKVDSDKKHLQAANQELKAVFSSAVSSLVQPVQFVGAFTEMVLGDPDDPTGRSVDVLLEVSPHTALGSPIHKILICDQHAGDSSGYICLAIEATKQLDKTGAMGQDKSRRDISAFRLRDVNYLFALVIPDNADSVEIRTTLCPLFQNTTKIIQDGREPRSICNITIRHEASSDTDPVAAAQNTLIHPITLNAVVVAFYSALPSVGALQEDLKLLRSVASMWVSSNISGEIGHTLHCDTLVVHEDPQSGIADIIVFDGKTDAMVLKVQGIKLVSLGRSSGVTARRDAANNGNTIANKWEQELCKLVARATEDRTLDEAEERQQLITAAASYSVDEVLICRLGSLLTSILCGESDEEEVSGLLEEYNAKAIRQTSAITQLSTLLLKLAHKNPAARVLQIGSGFGARATSCILKMLGNPKTPLVTSWHITEPSSESLENTCSQLVDWVDLLEFD
ncbi:acyl transferase acyl hydrolase lysophospholipase [Fusarium phyllophilum]|uniref:Acyl transferase acyl hydrolase lysophospholipase n=1 Tax=Fusarium phyllophilum TaxID=47803 RepID=A0A8H5NL72_9HYPO|nr:acyl transferase acyl hydrolase lysophospholipase [Fusarium phyllophilum]